MCVRTWLAAMTMPWLLGSSLAGCAAVPKTGVEYCDHARPVYFGTAAEVDATPPGVEGRFWNIMKRSRASAF